MNPSITDIIHESVKFNEPVVLVSRTGMGKTTLVKKYAKDNNMDIFNISLASSDTATILGMNFPVDKGFIRHDSPLVTAIKKAQRPDSKELIIFFDEILSAEEEIYSVLQTLIMDNYLDYEQLKFKKVHFIGATNTVQTGSNVTMPSQSFAERFAWFPVTNIQDWADWFYEQNQKEIPVEVKQYIQSEAKSDVEDFVQEILDERTSPRDFTKSYELVSKGARNLGKYVVSNILYDSVVSLSKSKKVDKGDGLLSEQEVINYIKFYSGKKQFELELDNLVRKYRNVYPRIQKLTKQKSNL